MVLGIDAQIFFIYFVGFDGVSSARVDYLTAAENIEFVGKIESLLDILFNYYEGCPAPGKLREGSVDFVDHDWGKAKRGLVDEDNGGLGDIGAGQSEHLLFTSREAARRLAQPPGEGGKQLGDLLDGFCSILTAGLDCEVLGHCERGEYPSPFGQKAYASSDVLVGFGTGKILAREFYSAGSRFDEPGGGA